MNIRRIPIGTVGTIELSLPVITIGRGSPVVAVVTGLHGGEESGLLILRDLLVALKRRPFKGTLRLLPSGNPLTQAFKTRFSPIDFVNPNRAFPGNESGDLSQRIAAEAVRAVRRSDAVVDLHCFSQNCAVTGILVSSGDPAVVEANRRLLGLFAPDCVWAERTATPDGESIKQNLGGYLNSVGVPNIAVETPRAEFLTAEMRRRTARGLMSVLRGVESPRIRPKVRLLELGRRDVRADKSGMFVPFLKPLSALSRGTVVGRLVDLPSFRETAVVSPTAGRLLLVARAGLVRTGDKLFAVGPPVRYTTR